MEQKLTRFHRAQKKQRLEPAMRGPESPPDDSADQETTKTTCDAATETTLSAQDVHDKLAENEMLHKRIVKLERELAAANHKIAMLESRQEEPIDLPKVTEDIVMKSDKTVKFHTGLVSKVMFSALLGLVLSIWTPTPKTRLNPQQQFIMVLMRLRLGLLTKDLAGRFGVSAGSVSEVFHAWIDVLAVNMQKFVIWPSRKALRAHQPKAFKDPLFENVRGIIDCTEVFIQRPTYMTARSQTYSNYKHHNTVKLLVVVSPSGAISFVSKAWGGRVSDKKLTLHSGLLDKVEEGDVFLVDRGFRCEEMFGARGAVLVMPSMTKRRKQLPGGEVTASRKLSSVRIHVERAIQRLKVFRIFQTVLPISFIKRAGDGKCATIDKLVVACSGLVNLQTPIINDEQ